MSNAEGLGVEGNHKWVVENHGSEVVLLGIYSMGGVDRRPHNQETKFESSYKVKTRPKAKEQQMDTHKNC